MRRGGSLNSTAPAALVSSVVRSAQPPSPEAEPDDVPNGAPSGDAAAAVERDRADLSRLLVLLKAPLRPASSAGAASATPLKGARAVNAPSEAEALEQFVARYREQYEFSTQALAALFQEIFDALVRQRLCNRDWMERAPRDNVLRILQCLRVLMRDAAFQREFFNLGGIKFLSDKLSEAAETYFRDDRQEPFIIETLVEMSSIFQKLATEVNQREWIVACGTHRTLALLLSANDILILHCSLMALIWLARSEQPRSLIGELNCIEILLRIMQDYHVQSKRLAAELLHILCIDEHTREAVKVFDGIPVCLSVLHNDDVQLLRHLVGIVEKMARDPESSNEIRIMGGIPLLLSLLGGAGGKEPRDSQGGTSAPPTAERRRGSSDTLGQPQSPAPAQPSARPAKERRKDVALKIACCAALTQLALNDTNAHHIRIANGIYALGLLILPQKGAENDTQYRNLQANAFRALRFLFSVERNRRLFKRLFPPELFEIFIDVGHYCTDIALYMPMVNYVYEMPPSVLENMTNAIGDTNLNKTPTYFVGEYAVMELLGRGAFGSVYKVRKQGAQSFLALKEIPTKSSAFLGKTAMERDKSIGEIVNEVSIIESQMRHPNVVRYFKSFVEGDMLYIIMEYVEGASLNDYFNSLKEKNKTMPEDRIWKIFVQVVLGLRYIHKEKRIVHRDLTPANIMLDENDNVKITDFGLARQKQHEASVMQSVVGTIVYSCPEIIQHEPYGEKADVWSLGCILYQMATLKPPFFSSNMLSLATRIVEGDYDPLPEGFSPLLAQTVRACLTPDPSKRPDILEVCSLIAPVLVGEIDRLNIDRINTERELERERKRTQRHFNEASRNMQNYHRLFLASQERYDKMITMLEENRLVSATDDMHGPSSPSARSASSGALAGRPRQRGGDRGDGALSPDEGGPRDGNRDARGSPVTPYRRSNSNASSGGARTPRPVTATATLTISPRKVRQINDPISQMLNQLHKIIFITQLPPSADHNPARRVIEKYKRALFSSQSSTFNLKSELKKFLIGSKDIIDLDFGSGLNELQLARQAAGAVQGQAPAGQPAHGDDGPPSTAQVGRAATGEVDERPRLTYEQMQGLIESVLVESGYYDLMSPRNRAQALGPIAGGGSSLSGHQARLRSLTS